MFYKKLRNANPMNKQYKLKELFAITWMEKFGKNRDYSKT